MTAGKTETEVKLRISGRKAFSDKVSAAGLRLQTPRTFEDNRLFDRPDQELRSSGRLLRLRRYGNHWTLTFKSKSADSTFKVREEIETKVENGESSEAILFGLGYQTSFRYQKYRTEWTDGAGHVVLDETPIGDFAELEGPPHWIDDTATKLGFSRQDYLTKTYAELHAEWRRTSGSAAKDMVFAAE